MLQAGQNKYNNHLKIRYDTAVSSNGTHLSTCNNFNNISNALAFPECVMPTVSIYAHKNNQKRYCDN